MSNAPVPAERGSTSHQAHLTRRQFIAAAAMAAATLRAAVAAEAAPANAYKIGCYTRPWDKFDWHVAMDAIAEAGFHYVGLMTTNTKNHLILSAASTVDDAKAVGEECKKRSLKVASVWGGGFAVEKSLQAGVDDLKKLIDNCVGCGSPSLMVGGTGDPKLHEVYYKAVAEACDYAATKSVSLTVKPHGGSNSTGAQCRKIIELVNKKNFGLWYDPGNIFFYSNGKIDPVDDSTGVDGLVVGMSVKDFRPLPDAATTKSVYTGDVALTPGTGLVNFKAVLANLKKGGFTGGPLIVECLAKGDLPALAAEAKKARAFLEDLTGQKA